MVQHLSIRAPWHDNGWDGTICSTPDLNTSCLAIKKIAERKNDALECRYCGMPIESCSELVPCSKLNGRFMSKTDLQVRIEYPYKWIDPSLYSHLQPTLVTFPAYSFVATPYRWMLRKNIIGGGGISTKIKEAESFFDPMIEPMNTGNAWLLSGENQRRIQEHFFENVKGKESLCVAYTQGVPFIDNYRKVVVAVGHVRKVIPAVEFDRTNENGFRAMTWEIMICHSIREDCSDGFVIPYQRMMEYAVEHPDFDLTTIAVSGDYEGVEMSYMTEHLSNDTLIDILLSCLQSFEIIERCLCEDYSHVKKWINDRIIEIWRERGIFPGFGSMLCALGIEQGVLLSHWIKEINKIEEVDFWETVDNVFQCPEKYLPDGLVYLVDEYVQGAWKSMPTVRKNLFKLLSRIHLSIEQANMLFHNDERTKEGINLSDADILENPYLIYEKTCLKRSSVTVSFRRVDRAMYPLKVLRAKYPLESPTAMKDERDGRRVRALMVYTLEEAAEEGHTYLSETDLLTRMQAIILQPECKITEDYLPIYKEEYSRVITEENGCYRLSRLEEFERVIKLEVERRLSGEPLEISANWQGILYDRYGSAKSEEDKASRAELSLTLGIMAVNRISVLVGEAGTGKTTALSILCQQEQIRSGGILLLAPTGKATIRMKELMNDSQNIEAFNVAQFLLRNERFDGNDKRYKLSKTPNRGIAQTVIIDESSMLTLEMMGAIMEAVHYARRVIFVGDVNQLPPIGAGKPFVDLAMKFKEEVPSNYARLSINHRQTGEDKPRLDVQFAQCFVASSDVDDAEVVEKITDGKDSRIEFIKCETRASIEKNLLELITPATIDDWQVLSPVKNYGYGVRVLNRLLHRLRCNYGNKETLGTERIGLGDRVINVKNQSKPGYSLCGVSESYVANGEFGKVVDVKNNDDGREISVEFQSQKGVTYKYNTEDFDTGQEPLELAYALTVHKAQGSQFKNVALVISEPCPLLSRELLYTALTRHTDKLVILYNRPIYELLNQIDNSAIEQR